MSKTIKTLFMISVLLFAVLQSASSSKLRSLQDETSFELGDAADTSTNPAPENDNDGTEGFELEDQGSSEPAPDNAANYDLGDADAEAAPAPTTNEATDAPLGTGVEDDNTSFTLEDGDSTSFALGDEDDTQTVTNTQANVATTTSTETSFNLGDEQPVGASVGDVLSFDLKDTDEQDTSVGTGSGSTDEASFNLDDNDDTNNVDLTDPADDESSSTDKSSSGANRGLAAGADVTVTTTTGNAKSGFSLQTGLVMSLVAVVSALVY